MPVLHRKHLSKLGIASYIKPYLLRGLKIDHRNQVRCIDITCKAWIEACAQHPETRVSMDGRGRAKDNIGIERFWKTIKYEYIYILPEENGVTLYIRPAD